MNIGSRLETKMDALRQSARDRFREESFAKGPPQYDIVTISSDKETTSPLTTDGATIDRIERLSKAMQPTSLLLVKILFDLPLDRHIFHTSESHFLRLLNAFEIDSYWLDMIANDMTGFHHLGRNSETSSYYLQCAAYKFIWASNSKHKCTKAIALINNTRKSRDALDECIPIMHANIKFLSHPLFLLVSGAIQTVRFMDGMLREQYVQCKTSEAATGFRTLPVGVVTRENVLELSGMAQRVGTLLIKIEMIIRRVKQWQLAMDTFKRFHDEQCGEVLIGQQKTSGQDSSLLTAVEVMQSKFKVMEIDFNYIRARADNQRTAILRLMAREEALTSIQISTATSRDSTSMKVIAVMTMVFLPGTFFAALFAVPSLQWNTTPVVQDNFWVYWAFTLPATGFVLMLWAVLTKRELLARFWS